MKRVYLVIGLCLLVAVLSLSAAAVGEEKANPSKSSVRMMQTARPGFGASPEVSRVLRAKEKLQLTDEQVKKLEALDAKIKAANEVVVAKRKALNEAVQAKAKESAIRDAATEFGKALGDQAVLQVNTQGEIDGILTDAQKATLKELKPKRDMSRAEPGDWRARSESMRARYSEDAFKRIDTNGDGVISLEEYKNQMGPSRPRPGIERPRGPLKPK